MTESKTQEIKETANHQQAGFMTMINIRKILMMMLKNWYFFLIGIILSGAGAYYYLKYKIPTYMVETTILIGEEDNA